MITVSSETFDELISASIDALPKRFKESINNVAFIVEDFPSPEQRQKLQLSQHQSLFGLYGGVPLTQRGANYTLVLPDKITIFKLVIEAVCQTPEELSALVRRTVWHEVAHHFGLGHGRIEELERKAAQKR